MTERKTVFMGWLLKNTVLKPARVWQGRYVLTKTLCFIDDLQMNYEANYRL